MYIMYADESGNTGSDLDNKKQPIFVLSGILVETNKWHHINDYFNRKKIEILPILKNTEIHTTELFNSSKKSVFRQFSWQENFKTIEKLIDVISELDINVYYIAIDKKWFKKGVNTIFNNSLEIDPYIYSFEKLYNNVSQILYESGNNGIIFLDDMLSIPSKLHNIYPTISQNNHTIIEEAIFVNSQNTNFIQIADIFAFYIEKYLSINNNYKTYDDIKQKHCLDMYKKLSKKINTDASEFIKNIDSF